MSGSEQAVVAKRQLKSSGYVADDEGDFDADRTVANKVDDVADPAEDGKSTAVQKATMNTLNIPDSKRAFVPASEFKNGGYVADDDKYFDTGPAVVIKVHEVSDPSEDENTTPSEEPTIEHLHGVTYRGLTTLSPLDIDRRSVLSGDSDASRLRSECCTCNGDDDDCLSYSSVSSSEDSAPRKPSSACKVHDAPTDDCASYISEIFLGKGKPPRSALSSETIHNNVTNPNSACPTPDPLRCSAASPYRKQCNCCMLSKDKPRKRVTSTFNSFDYFETENEDFLRRQSQADPRSSRSVALIMWLVAFLIGLYVAIIAVGVTLMIKYLTGLKLAAIKTLLEDCSSPACLVVPTLVWMAINMAVVFVGSYLVTFHAPLAAGSGIPNVKCYLNGIQMPGLMSLRTLLAKAGGVVLSVTGGLACGKEGPMIHSGALCASSLSRAEFRCCKKSLKPKLCDPLRTDEQRRDFVASGAASGVSAAFGSPIGGVLFSLEEGASFVKQKLTWRMLFSSMTACLVVNVLLSAAIGHPGNLSHPGLVSFGQVGDISFRALEIPIFIVMGIIGGLTGALFVQLNYKITLFRRRYNSERWFKVGEAMLVASLSALIFMVLIFAVPDCKPIHGFNATATTTTTQNNRPAAGQQRHLSTTAGIPGNSTDDDVIAVDDVTRETTGITDGSEEVHHYEEHGGHGDVFQGFCEEGQHNRMADILFKTGEGGLHAVLHAPLDEWNFLPLVVTCIVYHLLATWTYGLSVSSGVFIPLLLIGSLWGRVVGMLVMAVWPAAGTNIAKYVLVGAAANLGGATRMTLSLTVIIIECTGDITFGVPIILTLIVAKWMGDFFNPGIYDLHIEVQGVPLLPWEPPELSYTLTASDVMTSPIDCLNVTETMGQLREIVEDPHSHNGYPVVEDYCPSSEGHTKYGRLKGFILKKQLTDIVKDMVAEDSNSVFSLHQSMNISPYSIQQNITLPRIFKIFRGLGLRHLVVVNDRNRVVGIITRINLARYRSEMHKGFLKLEELAVSQT